MKTILSKNPIIPVMVIDNLDDAIPLANALIQGGLDVLEITLRTDVAIEAVKEIKAAFPEATVGTGTVINKETFVASQQIGADFMVSPGMTNSLLNLALTEKVNFLPGIATPSEAMTLLDMGFTSMKFFPAEAAGGCDMLKSISGPLSQITFCPTGGISMKNARNYLALSNVACVGGSWMLDKTLIENKDWPLLTQGIQQLMKEL